MSPETPRDPFDDLSSGAAHMFALVLAWIEAGFTRPEAVYLAGVVLSASVRGPGGGTS